MNILKTALLLTALTLLLVWFGGALGGQEGAVFAFGFACLMNFGAYWFSDKLVLAIYHAVPVSETQAPGIYRMVRELASEAHLPVPRIYRIPSNTANAFATGRNPQNAVVAVTDGILELLSEEELKGVLAHELSHVEHRDILISTVAATFAGAVSLLADMARWSMMFGGRRPRGKEGGNPVAVLLMMILAPIAALLIQLAVSRSREFHADERGGRLCGNPLWLASALLKLEQAAKARPMREVNPSTAHLFIVNPLRGEALMSLFSTHPPIQERVARLEQMARSGFPA